MRWIIAGAVFLILCLASPVAAQGPTATPTAAGTSSPYRPTPISDINWASLPAKTPIPIDHTSNMGLNFNADDMTAEGINWFRAALEIYQNAIQLIVSGIFIIFGVTVVVRTFKRLRKEGYQSSGAVFGQEIWRETKRRSKRIL